MCGDSKSGYNSSINDGAGGPGVGAAPPFGTPPDGNYTVSATPIIVGITGAANLCSLDTLVIESSKYGTPRLPASPLPLQVRLKPAAPTDRFQ